MYRTLKAKLKSLWVILTGSNVHIIYQPFAGAKADSIGFGKADLKDLVIMSKELEFTHARFIEMVDEIATHNGDLRNLKELREAVEVIEDSNGR